MEKCNGIFVNISFFDVNKKRIDISFNVNCYCTITAVDKALEYMRSKFRDGEVSDIHITCSTH